MTRPGTCRSLIRQSCFIDMSSTRLGHRHVTTQFRPYFLLLVPFSHAPNFWSLSQLVKPQLLLASPAQAFTTAASQASTAALDENPCTGNPLERFFGSTRMRFWYHFWPGRDCGRMNTVSRTPEESHFQAPQPGDDGHVAKLACPIADWQFGWD